MRYLLKLLVCALLAWGLLAVTSGCRTYGVGYRTAPPHAKKAPPPWAPAHGRRAKHHYRYYPDVSVYFDAARGVYFYLSGGAWRTSVRLPSGIRISGSYVSLDMDVDKPYKFHKDVIRKHPPGQKKKLEQGPGKSKGKGKKY